MGMSKQTGHERERERERVRERQRRIVRGGMRRGKRIERVGGGRGRESRRSFQHFFNTEA